MKKKKSSKEISLVYIYVYAKFKKHLTGSPIVKPAYLLEILKRICRIPKVLHYPILKEMEKLELIRRINKNYWEVLRSDCTKKLKKYNFPNNRPWN